LGKEDLSAKSKESQKGNVGNMISLNKLKLIVIDVDGTMTDAGIYYDENGNELKKFCTKDAAGFFCAKEAGLKIMVLTGRVCQATTRRMTEMKVDYLCQNIIEKYDFLKKFLEDNNLKKELPV
jgi:3-deoxy-D-manno-octulosonate 8-phosphate phosphatase (KDO 8-P phosphatase)